MSSIFEFKNIVKRFGSSVALDDFSLTGERGTVTALLGGKTTALRFCWD
jgi:ABC-type Fe3+/spermidine/putrescine transport system ATPase subunit